MSHQFWQPLQAELKIWQRSALPGLLVIAGVVLARLMGGLQFLELVALDQLLRSRPPEPTDERIVIVGITEADIQRAKTYPIPDGVIAKLINQLQAYQPAVIGLDIVRDLPVEPGHAALASIFRSQTNLIGAEIALPDRSGYTVAPPLDLPSEQVGFADVVLDGDGYQRRSLLGAHDRQEEYHFSFTIRLAEAYLATQGIELNNGVRDPEAMRFDSVELTRFQPNTGGYVRADAGGNQILLNVRSGPQPFRVLSLDQIQAGQVDPNWLRGRIVLIGVMSFSAKDLASSGAIAGINPGRIYGVEMQAHAISQITSAVLEGRPLLKVWAEGWEYLWIGGWGILGISLGRWLRSPGRLLLALAIASGSLIGLSYGAILLGWWIPLVPALLGLVLNGAGLTAALFYRHEQDLRSRLEERQFVIQQIFDAIHSEPLQILSQVLREEQAQEHPSPWLSDLQRMKQEIYAIFGSAQRKVFDEAGNLQLGGEIEFALQAPLHELLYKVYTNTLERDLPHFSYLKFKIVQFDPLDTQHLRLEHKRALCRFLEEALCNVGKYAEGATQLTVICQQEGNHQVIRVTDNGSGLPEAAETKGQPLALKLPSLKFKAVSSGMGTQLAQNLAKQLGGIFRRYPNQSKGTVCELSWPKQKRWFHR